MMKSEIIQIKWPFLEIDDAPMEEIHYLNGVLTLEIDANDTERYRIRFTEVRRFFN